MSTIVTEVIEKLYSNVDGMQISLAERDRMLESDASFTYGEIRPDTFAEMLAVADPKPGEVFYDLGSGSGMAVFCAALLYDWSMCCGIEFVPGLFDVSHTILQVFPVIPEIKKHFPDRKFNVQFRNEDLLRTDFSNADVVFAHATTFGPTLWSGLQDKFHQLKSGTRFIINTKQLDSVYFEKISDITREMSWGDSTVFTYVKK